MFDLARIFYWFLYFIEWGVAHAIWGIVRGLLAIAWFAESVNQWLLNNITYFVEGIVNLLEAPLAVTLILAVASLGVWYILNTIINTPQWVRPQDLFTYGVLILAFFAAPAVAVEFLEGVRVGITDAIQDGYLSNASGELFPDSTAGTDAGLPTSVPDVYPPADGVVGSFDLTAVYLSISNIDEIDSAELPLQFENSYFSSGDPATIDLTDEADRTQAVQDGIDGIQRLASAILLIPLPILDHLLRAILTATAILIYISAPFAMLLAWWAKTQSYLTAYLQKFLAVIIETFISTLVSSIAISLAFAAAQEGAGLLLGASILACLFIGWRISSAVKIATSIADLFGGAQLTGGATGSSLVRSVTGAASNLAVGAVGLATGGGAMALAGVTHGMASTAESGGDETLASTRTQRAHRLEAVAGRLIASAKPVRQTIETAYELRTLATGGREEPDTFDRIRAGASFAGRGTSIFQSMVANPALQGAYKQIAGQTAVPVVTAPPLVSEEMPPEMMARFWAEQTGTPAPAYDPDNERVYQSQRQRVARYHQRWTQEQLDPEASTPFIGEDEEQYQAFRQQAGEFAEREGAEWVQVEQPAYADPSTEASYQQFKRFRTQRREQLEQDRLNALTQNDSALAQQQERLATREAWRQEQPPVQGVSSEARELVTAVRDLIATLQQQNGQSVTEPFPERMQSGNQGSLPKYAEGDEPTIKRGKQTDTVPISTSSMGKAKHPMFPEPVEGSDSPIITLSPTPAEDWQAGEPSEAIGIVRLTSQTPQNRQTIDQLATEIEAGGERRTQAMQTLTDYAGADVAEQISHSVTQHDSQIIHTASETIQRLISQQEASGATPEQIRQQFWQGEFQEAVRQESQTPLSDEAISALAETILQPQVSLTPDEMAQLIRQSAVSGRSVQETLKTSLPHFGSLTGEIRKLHQGMKEMKLGRDELAQILQAVRQGGEGQVVDQLQHRADRMQALDFTSAVRHIINLPTIDIPQTLQPQSGLGDGEGETS